MRNQYKVLSEKYVSEIGQDTLARAAQSAYQRGRSALAQKFSMAADQKAQQQIANIIGTTTDVSFIEQYAAAPLKGTIISFGKLYNGQPTVEIKVNEVTYVFWFDYDNLTAFRQDLTGRSENLENIRFDRQSRIKMVKLFKHMGLNITPNNIEIIAEDGIEG